MVSIQTRDESTQFRSDRKPPTLIAFSSSVGHQKTTRAVVYSAFEFPPDTGVFNRAAAEPELCTSGPLGRTLQAWGQLRSPHPSPWLHWQAVRAGTMGSTGLELNTRHLPQIQSLHDIS